MRAEARADNARWLVSSIVFLRVSCVVVQSARLFFSAICFVCVFFFFFPCPCREAQIHPSSTLWRRNPPAKCVVYTELLSTSRDVSWMLYDTPVLNLLFFPLGATDSSRLLHTSLCRKPTRSELIAAQIFTEVGSIQEKICRNSLPNPVIQKSADGSGLAASAMFRP